MNEEYKRQLEERRVEIMSNKELTMYLRAMDFEIRRLYSDIYVAELLNRIEKLGEENGNS